MGGQRGCFPREIWTYREGKGTGDGHGQRYFRLDHSARLDELLLVVEPAGVSRKEGEMWRFEEKALTTPTGRIRRN